MGFTILVITEQKDGVFKKAALEAASEARRIADQIGGKVVAAVLGAGIAESAKQLGTYGVNTVCLADHPALSDYTSESYTQVLAAVAAEKAPDLILVGATTQGKELAACLAARLDAGLAMDCTRITAGERFIFTRPIFGGKILADLELSGTPKMAAIRPNIMAVAESPTECTLEKAAVTLSGVRSTVVAKQMENSGKVELTEAKVIVSGGRGTRGDFTRLEALAAELKAAVGASRAVVDEGWRPPGDQVGQTGRTVSPNLYFACGISGAIQHLAGMSGSKYVVAVNTDPQAPIFAKADFGIVGDCQQVVPAVLEELKRNQ